MMINVYPGGRGRRAADNAIAGRIRRTVSHFTFENPGEVG